MSSKPPAASPPTWVLLLQGAEPEVLSEAAAMAASAVSLGLQVTLVWFGGALEALVSGRLSEEQGEPRSAAALLAQARETGRLRMLACSASMVSGGFSPEQVRSAVDDLIGWPTAISLIRGAERSFVW